MLLSQDFVEKVEFEVKVTGNYSTKCAKDKKDAVRLALIHLRAELNRWYDGNDKKMAGEIWDIEAKQVD